MLRTELIEIINGGNAWAFIGSGASVDAGLPTWKGLVEATFIQLDEAVRARILEEGSYQSAFFNNNFARCFSLIERYTGREPFVSIVAAVMRQQTAKPSHIHTELADWPFTGYVTTNYDLLMEKALLQNRQTGWSTVGNSTAEVKKISAGVSRVVWHTHGAVAMSSDRSNLILTENDYEDIYIEDSPVLTQLRALLSQHRVVFIGFGFNDTEVLRLLRRVGRLSNPARPIYAFLGFKAEEFKESENERKELLERYNVEVIPYHIIKNSHKQLSEMLDAYGALILRRSLRFGQPALACPSYDPQATGLLIYNELCLKDGSVVTSTTLSALLRARILSRLKFNGPCKTSDFVDELMARAELIRNHRDSAVGVREEIDNVLEELKTSGLIEVDTISEANPNIRLTPKGEEIVARQAATAELLSDQFLASLTLRVSEIIADENGSVARVTRAAESFLKNCVEHRALGVAMTRFALRQEHQRYHMVALLQALPKYMAQLETQEEALALSKLVQGVLSKPTDAEAKYIGLALQSQFGVHLLGFDPDTFEARARELVQTLFLVDATTLIPFVATSSMGYNSARLLIDRMKTLGSVVATTALLTQEVAEHARWAIRKADHDAGKLKIEILREVTGRNGEKPNAFLEGYLTELDNGRINPDFIKYLNELCGFSIKNVSVTDVDVATILDTEDVHPYYISEWIGFTDDIYAEIEKHKKEITLRRQEHGTYRHQRQVEAEAEALIIVNNFRDKRFGMEGREILNAYFISHTRIIDDAAETNLPFVMRPESALQWLTTITPCAVEELGNITNSLIWELHERNLAIVDKAQIQRTFAPLVNASKEKLDEELDQHRILISQKYGESALKALKDTPAVDVPLVLESLYAQTAEELTERLEREQKLRLEAQRRARVSEKDLSELEKLRAEKRIREQKARSRQRAAAASKTKKKKGKKHKK